MDGVENAGTGHQLQVTAIEHAAKCSMQSIKQSLSMWRERSLELVLKLFPAKAPADKERPFVFFHMHKGGGTALQHVIFEAAEKHNLSSWTPCFGQECCVPFSSPPNNQSHDVCADHVNFVHMAQLFRNAKEPQADHSTGWSKRSCEFT